MPSRSVLLIAASVLIAGSALATPAGAAILGPSTGVTAARSGTTLDVTFTPAALATSLLKTGTSVEANCYVRAATPPLVLADDDESTSDIEADAEGKVGADGVAHLTIQDGLNGQPGLLDYCEVDRLRHLSAHSAVSTILANVALTPSGAVWVDESEHAIVLRHLLIGAHDANGYEPVAAVGAGVVAMDSPDATPPAGQVGYWTDGTHASVATLSAAGRRLVVEDRGNLVVRSNVLDQLDPLGEGDLTGTTPSGSGSTKATGKSPEADGSKSPYKGTGARSAKDGVRAVRTGRRLTVRFTGQSASAFRAIAGRKVAAVCLATSTPRLFPDLTALPAAYGYGYARVPRHGGAVTVSLLHGTGDVCYLVDEQTAVAIAGATPAGRRYMQDVAAVAAVSAVRFAAAGAKAYRTTAQVLAHLSDTYVAMDGPDGAVAPGKVGVWTDGAHRAALVARSVSGFQYVEGDEGDGMQRTNAYSMFSSLFFTASLAFDDLGSE